MKFIIRLILLATSLFLFSCGESKMGKPTFSDETFTASEGKQIVDQIYRNYPTVDRFYHKPIFQQVLFPEKVHITLQLPQDAWDQLTPLEKKKIGKYVSSYIPQVMADPFSHTSIDSTAPIASRIKQNAQLLTYDKWTIEIGELTNGGADILPKTTIEPYQIR